MLRALIYSGFSNVHARPVWLDLAHLELDKAAAAAYGWTDYSPRMPDDEILRRLLKLNLERSSAGNDNVTAGVGVRISDPPVHSLCVS